MTATETESLQELQSFNNGHPEYESENANFQSLPATDTSKEAWRFLAACFVVEAMVWGFPFSFGQFQVYYASHEPFSENLSGIASIGTSATVSLFLHLVVVSSVLM